MDYSLRVLEKLGKAFNQFFFFAGNHDLFYKDKRDLRSIEFGKYIPGITIVHTPVTMGNVTLCPWLVGDEWKSITKSKSRYMFGHFELPLFMMNALVQMPDHGQLQTNQFTHQEFVFSGHFHKRQRQGNVMYIGNAFPHNYADAGDDDRGMMTLEWGGQPQFYAWPKQPIFRTYKLSEIITSPDALLKEGMHARVSIDIQISFEEASFIRETFIPQYKMRELMLISEKVNVETSLAPVVMKFESVDTIVSNQITAIDSESYDKKMLLDIYNNL
jgi:hypothetical protein